MERYYKLIRILRKECPPAFPVSVRRLALKDDGFCQKKSDKFIIGIDKTLTEREAIDTLLHEWSHARAWNHLHDAMDEGEFEKKIHDAAWGVAYSEVYRIYEEKLLS